MMRKFFSRKLFAAMGSVICLASAGQYQEAAVVAVGYILAQAGVDIISARKGK